MLVWRVIAGLLALAFTGYGLLLLGAAIADRAIVLPFAAAAGAAAVPFWWFALRRSARIQRLFVTFLAILFTAYALSVLWISLAHGSAGGLFLGAVIAIVAIPCWRFVFRKPHAVRDESSH